MNQRDRFFEFMSRIEHDYSGKEETAAFEDFLEYEAEHGEMIFDTFNERFLIRKAVK